jgi:hypothetical protein
MRPRSMTAHESHPSRPDPPHLPGESSRHIPKEFNNDILPLEAALQAKPQERFDRHLGPGVIFTLGAEPPASLELFTQVVRVTVPAAQLVVPRRDAEVVPDGVVFQDPDHFFLSVGLTGEVLFQYFPPSGAPEQARTAGPEAHSNAPPSPAEPPRPISPPPTAEAKEKVKSERYVGMLGIARTHRTRQGKLVAEVELTVPDPERPGASRLIKCAAFGEKAEALHRDYQPGQEVTAVGIPHELQRRSKDGQTWTERQLYLVQLPKPRESS